MVNEKRKEQMKEYRVKNKEKIRLQKKEYYQKNRKGILKKIKEYRDKPKNKVKKKKYMERYYQEKKSILLKNNKIYRDKPQIKEEIKSYDKKRQQTPERQKRDRKRNQQPKRKAYNKIYHKKYQRQRRQTDECFRILHNLRSHFCRVMYLYSTNGKNMSSKKYGVDWEGIINYLGPQPIDGNNYEVDHIIPLSLFDHNDPEQIKKAWAPENYQWLTKEINMWKGNRLIKPLTNKQKIKLQVKLTEKN